jgi:hypothetical protein
MGNEVVGFGAQNLFSLSELIIKCVIGFGKFVRILNNQWK